MTIICFLRRLEINLKLGFARQTTIHRNLSIAIVCLIAFPYMQLSAINRHRLPHSDYLSLPTIPSLCNDCDHLLCLWKQTQPVYLILRNWCFLSGSTISSKSSLHRINCHGPTACIVHRISSLRENKHLQQVNAFVYCLYPSALRLQCFVDWHTIWSLEAFRSGNLFSVVHRD